MTSRPRRTRIYGANYDIGESYYKKALQNLDSKYDTNRYPSSLSSIGSEDPFKYSYTPSEEPTPRTRFSVDRSDDDFPLTRGLQLRKKNVSLRENLLSDHGDDDFPISASILPRKHLSGLDDYQNEFNGTKSCLKNKLFDSENEVDFSSSIRQRKVCTESLVQGESLVSEASSRAKSSKARLADLESEIQSITEKQNEREKRNIHLKQLLAEANED